jgi:hypothetical protein
MATQTRGDADREFERVRVAFEAAEGFLLYAFWGINVPVGIAVTLKPRPRLLRYVGAPDLLRMHRSTERIRLPAELEVALADADALAVTASGVLRDASQRVVLQRVFTAESFLLSIIDTAGGDLPRPAPAKPTSGEEVSQA